MKKVVSALMLLACLWLAGCANHPPVEVVDSTGGRGLAAPAPAVDDASYYVVKKGDTLYSIALNHGQNYRDVASWNNLENPSRIEIGQRLRIARPGDNAADGGAVATAVPVPAGGTDAAASSDNLKREPKGGKQPYSADAAARLHGDKAKPAVKEAAASAATTGAHASASADGTWIWPTKGKVAGRFGEGKNKGIDIVAKAGSPVYAAASGKVTYTGNRIPGYGNLLVIRHNDQLLSVYAHNSRILVAEKQSVTKGQKIAEVGNSDAEHTKLHFEIRRQGVPVDPMKYLPEK